MPTTIAFIGLGAMGLPIASRLLEAGHRLRIYNRTREKAASLVARGAELVDTPAAAVEPDGLVLTMLADDAALEAVTTGVDGILDRLGEGGVHASFSTIAPRTARRLAEAHAGKNASYVSAPVLAARRPQLPARWRWSWPATRSAWSGCGPSCRRSAEPSTISAATPALPTP